MANKDHYKIYNDLQIAIRRDLADEWCADVEFPAELIHTEYEGMFEEWLDLLGYSWFPTNETDGELYYTICQGDK